MWNSRVESPAAPRLCEAMRKPCSGFSRLVPCMFSKQHIGKPVRDPRGSGKCLFCDTEKMAEACGGSKTRANIIQSLRAFRAHYTTHNFVYNAAVMRVPDEWRDDFHAAALKSKRGRAAKPRAAPAVDRRKQAAEEWKGMLVQRKRAFADLRSAEVTAYKKRRKADRNRVAKKFFVDNDLPQPEAADIAANDCGMPAASTSERATLTELWCKYGSWEMCKGCKAMRPRPLWPMDTRRVAPCTVTQKLCKVCKNGKYWIPQPEDIPRPLRKLSVKMTKVLRPLDIDAGPVKKASNGYRAHSAMIRFRWSERTVMDKIQKAPCSVCVGFHVSNLLGAIPR